MLIVSAGDHPEQENVVLRHAGDHPEQGGFGEVLTTACMAKGIVGLVTDAGARDGAAIHRRGFSVFCYGLCMKGTVKETLGTVGQPIVIGGIAIHPGDIVSADDDGVVIVPRHNIADVVKRSAEREAKEAATMEALAAKGDILQLSGMGKVLAAKNCTYG